MTVCARVVWLLVRPVVIKRPLDKQPETLPIHPPVHESHGVHLRRDWSARFAWRVFVVRSMLTPTDALIARWQDGRMDGRST